MLGSPSSHTAEHTYPEGRRRGSHRLRGREMGGIGQGDRGSEARRGADGEGADRMVPGEDRKVQDPEEGGI